MTSRAKFVASVAAGVLLGAGMGKIVPHSKAVLPPVFNASAPQPLSCSADNPTEAVVFTGPGQRIKPGVEFYDEKKVDKLLITQVGTNLCKRDFIHRNYGKDPERALDGITFDYEALDTRGNARATAKWLDTHPACRLVVIAGDTQMPKAITELRSALSERNAGLPLLAYPIHSAISPEDAGKKKLNQAYSEVMATFHLAAPIKEEPCRSIPVPRNEAMVAANPGG